MAVDLQLRRLKIFNDVGKLIWLLWSWGSGKEKGEEFLLLPVVEFEVDLWLD